MKMEDELAWLVEDIRKNQLETPKTIIYSPFITSGTEIFIHLMSRLEKSAYLNGINDVKNRYIMQYHSRSGSSTKEYVQEVFSRRDSHVRILISTVAFGMGIDIGDVRRVIHWGISTDSLCYWQEIGRAGRDGEPAEAFMYCVPQMFNSKIQDKEFILSMKKLSDIKMVSRTATSKFCSAGTQTLESNLSGLTLSSTSVAGPQEKPDCLRQIVLSDFATTATQSSKLLTMSRVCSSEECLINCCTFCRKRCQCS